jgi:hypothetical protein
MSLDPATRQQLIEARERIKAQLIDDERASRNSIGRGGPPALGDVYAELQDELRQIDEMLGIDPDKDNDEPGDEEQEFQATSVSASPDREPAGGGDTDAKILASRVVVDDAATWNLTRLVLIAAVLGIAIAAARALRIF